MSVRQFDKAKLSNESLGNWPSVLRCRPEGPLGEVRHRRSLLHSHLLRTAFLNREGQLEILRGGAAVPARLSHVVWAGGVALGLEISQPEHK